MSMRDCDGIRESFPQVISIAGKFAIKEMISNDVVRYRIDEWDDPAHNGFICMDAITGVINGLVGDKEVYHLVMNNADEMHSGIVACIEAMEEEYKRRKVIS